MAIITEVGTFDGRASAGTQTISLTSSIWDGATPKGLIIWHGVTTAAGGDGIFDHGHFGFGMAISSASRIAFACNTNNAAATSNSVRTSDNANIITTWWGAYVADLDSFGAESFVLDWSASAAALQYNFMAIGGDGIDDIHLDVITALDEDDDTTLNYTNGHNGSTIDFQPDAMICLCPNTSSEATNNDDITGTIGMTDFTNEYSMAWWAEDNVATTDSNRIQGDNFFQTFLTGTTNGTTHCVGDNTTKISSPGNGYSIDWVNPNYARPGKIYVLAFKTTGDDGIKVYKAAQVEDTTASRSIGFAPGGALFASVGTTNTTKATDCRIGVGGWDSLDNMAFAGMLDEDNVATTDTNKIQDSNEIFKHYDHTPTLNGSATVAADGNNLVETWAGDATARNHIAIVFGEPPADVASTALPMAMTTYQQMRT